MDRFNPRKSKGVERKMGCVGYRVNRQSHNETKYN